jgi:release factor glutamine methyltransferase
VAPEDWDEEDAVEEHHRDHTFGELLEEGTRLLGEFARTHPRDEAIRLFRGLRGPDDFSAPLPDQHAVIGAEQSLQFLLATQHLGSEMPFAYVVGWAGFRHLVLATDDRALIPRPETEGLVDLALLRVRTGVAADVGTGTGALALSLAKEGDFATVIGTDISPAALELAAQNGERNALAVSWRLGDLLAPLAGERLDLLVSNPPYLSTLEYDALDASVRDHEPATALIGGLDGLDFYRRLLAEAPAVMAPGGWIALEIDARRPRESAEIAAAHGWSAVRIFDDLFGRPRYLLARRETMT